MAVAVESEIAREPPSSSTTTEAGGRLSPLEMFAAAVALVLPIAYASGLAAEVWSARSAIGVVVAAVGLPLLLSQARGPKPLAARAAVAFLGIGCVSAALSANHTTAIFGLYGQGTGLLFMASLAAAWAIGRSLRPAARPVVETALIVGIGVNVAVALLASVVEVPSSLAVTLLDGGRSAGLAGNPVHLAALAVLGLALIIPRLGSARVMWAIPVAALAAAVQLSGTRLAVGVMAAMVLWAIRRQGARVAALLAVLIVLGLAVGSAIGPSGGSATARAAGPAVSGSWRPRIDTWLSARHAVVHHPLVGIGPGQFRTATSPYRSTTIARMEGPDRLFTDAHNLFIEYATTTGLLGAGALVVWLVAATRQGRGWLLFGALGVLALHLFEPQSVVSTPLAFLALGASGSVACETGRRHRSLVDRVLPTTCIVAGVLVALVLLAGALKLQQGQLDLRLVPAQQANRLLPAWPRPASLMAQVWLYTGIVDHHNHADYQLSRSWRLAAVQRDAADPALWNDLAELDQASGLNDDAQREFHAALRLNPTSVRALNGLAHLAHQSCDFAAERDWKQRALAVSIPSVAPSDVPQGRAQPSASACSGVGG